MNIYAHVSLDAQREALGKLNDLFAASSTTPDGADSRDPDPAAG